MLESPFWGDSNKHPKHMFYEEIRTKQELSFKSICSINILYNRKFILIATSLGTNAVVVTRVHCISYLKVHLINCAYIRPLLDYGSEVWGGCSITDANRLEQIQLNAARIITGLPVFASLRSLYYETGWESLADRRKRRKLMYKIVNGDSQSYIIYLLPNRVNDINTYNLGNRNNIEIPFSRLCSSETSYFISHHL